MEISVLGIGLQHGIVIRSSPISSLSNSSMMPSATRSGGSLRSFATALTGEIAQTNDGELAGGRSTIKVQKRPSKSRTARQAAIVEVQKSCDLDSALARYSFIKIGKAGQDATFSPF